MRALTLALSLTAALTGCGGTHGRGHGQTTGAAPAPAHPPVAKVTWDRLHFAKDGKCADRLVKAYEAQAKERHASEKVLAYNVRAYQIAKREHNVQLEAWAQPLRLGYAKLREIAAPFDEKYGTFACPHRQTGEILSSDRLGQGLSQLNEFMNNEVGMTPAQENKN